MHVWPAVQCAVPHPPEQESILVPYTTLFRSEVVVVVVFVGGHDPQSAGHVEQSSAGPHSPSPHTQLQGGDPPVQLQRPSWHSDVTCLRHALIDLPLRPLAATSSPQAVEPHGGAAFATEARTPTPSASTANTMSIL